MLFVTGKAQLDEALAALKPAAWAGVDTEADSLHHYLEKLCLVQVSVPGLDMVLDPLAVDLAEFHRVLVTKPLILQGADFDIRMLKRAYGAVPQAPVFDTMIAAQLLGYQEQGYAGLVRKHCAVELSKKPQKADWSMRPLTEEMLEYASNDTRFLKTLHDEMSEELRSLGRLDWHRQMCDRLLKQLAADDDGGRDEETAWQVKGSKELKGRALTLLRALWQWRDSEARRMDRPSFKVLHTEEMVKLAKWSSENPGRDVEEMPQAPRNIRGALREGLNRVVKQSLEHAPAVYVNKKPKKPFKRWTDKSEKYFLELKAERERLGKELKKQPSLIETNVVLETIAEKPPRNASEIDAIEALLPFQRDLLKDFLLKAPQV